jgi:hypothetical protein
MLRMSGDMRTGMAQIDYVEHGYGAYGHGEAAAEPVAAPSPRPRLGAVVNWAGALMSLGLVVGMGVWAFQLMIRDVSGVPVIEALDGPMRQPPADPGGTQAPHQGLAVNRIAEGEEAQPVPDRLVLAPPPIELQEVRYEPPEEVEPLPRAELIAADPTVAPEDGLDPATRSETTALIDRLLQEAQPGVAAPADMPEEEAVSALAVEETPLATPETEAVAGEFRVLPSSVPGIARSLRPSARPAAFIRSAPSEAGPAGTATATEEIPVTDLPDGTRLVQLGAYDTAEIAREEWERIAGRFPDFFDDRPRVIEAAESGGQTFFRLRAAGFDDLAGSRRFCAVLVAQGTACIPVTVR